MGQRRHPDKVKLIMGLIFKNASRSIEAKRRLERLFGRIDFESGLLDFTHTSYYKEEFGEPLKRAFLSFERTIDLKDIYKIKIKTGAIEKRLAINGNRTINIDPGYLNLSKLVLFSTKDYSHRLYLDEGIFAEVTLFYKDRCFKRLPWTYPDYGSPEYIEIFNNIRELYKSNLK